MQFIAIKKLLNNQKTLLISIDGSMRHLLDNKQFDINLGEIYEIELKNFAPEKLKIVKHSSDLRFEIGKTDVEGKNTFAVLKKENRSVFFDSKVFGRVACIDENVTLSKLDEAHPIIVTLITEEFKIGENSICHWGARIDTEYIPKPSHPQKSKKENTEPNKVQKQCIGVVTKVETNDKNVKSYFCWLTDQHISSVMFDQPKKLLNLQRGDYFNANFVKYKDTEKWKFVSFIEIIAQPLTKFKLFKDTISLEVELHSIKPANNSEFRANAEAFHPLFGNIVDVWDNLDDCDVSEPIKVLIVLQKYAGNFCWAISKVID